MISSAEVRALREELAAAGVYERDEWATWRRLALLLPALGACLLGVALLPLWAAFLLVPAAAVIATTAAMLGHEGCHGSFSDKPWQNQLLATLTFPLLAGLGVLYWKDKHNVRHHGHPNVLGQDPDIEMWPMAISKEEYDASSAPRRFFQRHLQAWFFWPLTLFLPVVMRWPSLAFLATHARKRGFDRAWWIDASALTAHYLLWLGGGALVLGPVAAVLLYVSMWSIVGVFLALIFAPAHMGLEYHGADRKGWVHQLETTRNLRVPRSLRWFFVGLDYQVEHHLFPKIPHRKLPIARDIVRAWCQRNGLPHQEIGYGAALVSVTASLRDAWKTSSVAEQPAPVARAA